MAHGDVPGYFNAYGAESAVAQTMDRLFGEGGWYSLLEVPHGRV